MISLENMYIEELPKNWVFQRISPTASKKAAQHGSGMHQVFDTISRSHGFDESTIPMGYLDNLRLRKRIGSSQRYGHLFENERMWIAEPHVQIYLKHFKDIANFRTKCNGKVS